MTCHKDSGRCAWCRIAQRLSDVTGDTGGLKCLNDGCLYSHTDSNMTTRHQIYFCTYREKKCIMCNEIHLGTRLLDHYKKKHCTELQTEVLGDVATTRFTLTAGETGMFSFYLLRTNSLVLYLLISPPDRRANRMMYLMPDSEMRSSEFLNISYTVTSNEIYNVVTKSMKKANDVWDWVDKIELNQFKKNEKSAVNIEITIKINNDVC